MADANQTYIRLSRKILLWEWYKNAVVKSLFIHLLLQASYDTHNFEGHTIERGQLIATLSSLSEGSGLSVKQVRNAIDKLESTGEIRRDVNPWGTVITVINYSKYQGQSQPKKDPKLDDHGFPIYDPNDPSTAWMRQ